MSEVSNRLSVWGAGRGQACWPQFTWKSSWDVAPMWLRGEHLWGDQRAIPSARRLALTVIRRPESLPLQPLGSLNKALDLTVLRGCGNVLRLGSSGWKLFSPQQRKGACSARHRSKSGRMPQARLRQQSWAPGRVCVHSSLSVKVLVRLHQTMARLQKRAAEMCPSVSHTSLHRALHSPPHTHSALSPLTWASGTGGWKCPMH